MVAYKSKQGRRCIFVYCAMRLFGFTNRHLYFIVLKRKVEIENFIQTELNRYHLLLLLNWTLYKVMVAE